MFRHNKNRAKQCNKTCLLIDQLLKLNSIEYDLKLFMQKQGYKLDFCLFNQNAILHIRKK